MESTRNEQSNSNNSANSQAAILGDTEQHIGRAAGAAVAASSESSTGESSSAIDFLGTRSAPQHQQLPVPSHHHSSIPTIPEDRAASGQHPSSDKQSEGGSPDPHSSATTTGTTSTPTSVGNSSPSPCDGTTSKVGGAPPDFPSESLGTDRSHWPSSIGEGIAVSPRYGPPGPSHAERPDMSHFNVPPDDSARYSSGFPCAIKLLVSNNVAGSIIGRAGQTISDLQTQSSTRIKLSQTGDYYPGSQDRVCLVQGQLDNVKGACSLLLERLYVLQEHQHTQHMAWQPNRSEGGPPFDFVVRILVPSSSCGMIIGKSGANIRHMEEASGVASVRLSPKDIVDPNYPSATIAAATSERIVTLTGSTLACCLNCLFIILDGMTSHPDICRYTNMTTSYSRLMPDPFTAGQPNLRPPVEPVVVGSEGGLWDSRFVAPPQQGGLAKRVSSSPDLSSPFIGHRPSMSMDGRQSQGGAPHTASRETLQYTPMFGGPPPPPPTSAYSPVRPQLAPRMQQSSGPSMYLNPMEHPMDHALPAASVHNSMSAPDLLALQISQMDIQSSPQHQTPPPRSSPHPSHPEYPLFPPQHPASSPGGPGPQGFSTQLYVPDNMVGSILGRGGQTLNDLQAQSGTRIRISQRGEYVPGTRDRLVTIRGATPENVNLAQYLMSQRMILPRTATYQQVPPPSQTPPVPSMYSAVAAVEEQQVQGAVGHPQHHLFHPHPADPHAQPPSFQHPSQQQQSSLQGPPSMQPSRGAQAPSSSTGTDHTSAT